MKPNRFDYVAYDSQATAKQNQFKQMAMDMESLIEQSLTGRAKDRALDALEVTYMWIGKGIRDAQIQRNGSAPLQEERTNG